MSTAATVWLIILYVVVAVAIVAGFVIHSDHDLLFDRVDSLDRSQSNTGDQFVVHARNRLAADRAVDDLRNDQRGNTRDFEAVLKLIRELTETVEYNALTPAKRREVDEAAKSGDAERVRRFVQEKEWQSRVYRSGFGGAGRTINKEYAHA